MRYNARSHTVGLGTYPLFYIAYSEDVRAEGAISFKYIIHQVFSDTHVVINEAGEELVELSPRNEDHEGVVTFDPKNMQLDINGKKVDFVVGVRSVLITW